MHRARCVSRGLGRSADEDRIARGGGRIAAVSFLAFAGKCSRALQAAGVALGAVFVQTNELAGNTIASYTRAANSVLTPAGRFATGGKGGAAVGAVSDRLASQGSLVYDGVHRLLFAVNAGSNSLSVFGVEVFI